MSSLRPIRARDLRIAYRADTVIDGLALTASPGRRVALIGENGTGKSTVLRAVAGRLPETATVDGDLDRPEDLMFSGQEAPFPDSATIGDVLATTLRPLRRAVAELERLAAGMDDPAVAARYAEVLEWAVDHDAWDADRRAEVAADRLGLSGLLAEADRVVGTLSGGQRTRLALATVMVRRPAALVLDEPTNHLDDDAISVLVETLHSLPGVVLFASHDRVFLDDVATDLVDLEAGGRRFGGGWSAYEAERAAARRRWEETYAAQQDEIARLRAATRIGTGAVAHGRGPTDNDKYITKFKGARVEATLARRKKDAERRLAEAESSQVRKPPPPLSFEGALTAAGAGGRMLQLRAVEVPGRLWWDRLDLAAGEHLLVTGPNGAGKSTLLGVLSGRITPAAGTVWSSARRVAELTQDPVFADPGLTPRRIYRAALGEAYAETHPLAQWGLLRPRDLETPVGALSVGQRRRLDLALTIARGPDLLLLDEPTNHLSLALAGELEEALGTTPGTVVVASHDRWLRRHWEGDHVHLVPYGAPVG